MGRVKPRRQATDEEVNYNMWVGITAFAVVMVLMFVGSIL